jgi:subtilisin family serine protease
MQRRYYRRGLREIEQTEDLVAIKPKERTIDLKAFDFGEIAMPHRILPATWVSFTDAGWIFVRPNPNLIQILGQRTLPDSLESIQQVFVGRGTQIYLGSDRLTVQLKPSISDPETTLSHLGLSIIYRAGFAPNLFSVQVPPGVDFLDASVSLSAMTDVVEFAEPDFIEHLPGRFMPPDPGFSEQWHLCNTGRNGGLRGADIDAVSAWDFNRGADIRIAIIDNGIDILHPDLAAAVSPVSGYFKSDGGHGANFVPGTGNFPSGDGHGTFCAGLAVARSNSSGGVGVANQAALIAIACLQDQVGSQMTLARAVAYAADPSSEGAPGDGADVICCSLGSTDSNGFWDMATVLQTAIDKAVAHGRRARGAPVFWATSDFPVPIANDEVSSYVNTIAVGMSDRFDKLGGSAYGPELDFLATGKDVYSTMNGGIYLQASGTSYAAPVAAGVAALVLCACHHLTAQQVRDVLRGSCDPVGLASAGDRNDYFGFGRINAESALRAARQACAASAGAT